MKRNVTASAHRYLKQAGAVDIDTVRERVEALLERPSNSFWHDDRLWNTHAIVLAHPYELAGYEYLIDAVNMEVAFETLRKYGAERAGFGHWTYSHFDGILVPLLTTRGLITRAACELVELLEYLRDYPILRDDDLNAAEHALTEQLLISEIDCLDISDNDKIKAYYAFKEHYASYNEVYGFINDLENGDIPESDLEESRWSDLVEYAEKIRCAPLTDLMAGKYY